MIQTAVWGLLGQERLFPDPAQVSRKLIARAADFDQLFSGYRSLRAISYVVSPDLLLEFFERGYSDVEAVVGDNLAERYRADLAARGADAAVRLASRLAAGNLRIFIPDRTLHSKLYILGRPGQTRVIATSANLTGAARRATRQWNYAWYADLPDGHPWIAGVEADYAAHRALCAPFMGDLAELMRKGRDDQRRAMVEAWLRAVPPDEAEEQARLLLQDVALRCLRFDPDAHGEGLVLRLPAKPEARREAERLLGPHATFSAGTARLDAAAYLRDLQNRHGVPILRVDRARREILAAEDGRARKVNAPLPVPEVVDRSLAQLENYIATVDGGRGPDPALAKASMCEALLYLLSAPFSDELMRLKRQRYGDIDSRGPRILYIYGPSSNGKSTFLRFALKLLAGRALEPLGGADFAKRRILGAMNMGTSFPLVFDDVVLSQRYGLFEEVLKSYWESWWNPNGTSPQLVLSSNAYSLRDWAKSRVKRLDFDVQFSPDGAAKEALARLFREENEIFRWFSGLYLDRLDSPEPLCDDELFFARRVFEDLYAHAGRRLPEYFPRQAIETRYDPGRRDWKDLLERLRQATVTWDGDRAGVHFSADIQHFEIRTYENALPAAIKHRRRGRTLIIETPAEFRAWLDGAVPARRVWWNRILRAWRPPSDLSRMRS